MKKLFLPALALILALSVLTGCVTVVSPEAEATAVPAETAAPEENPAQDPQEAPTATPVPEEEPTPDPNAEKILGKSVKGTVVYAENTALMITMENGNTIVFGTANFPETAVRAGDIVEVGYEGDITSSPQATSITVLQSSPINTITGTVAVKSDNNLYVEITSKDILCFKLTDHTVISGEAQNVVADDEVEISFEGDVMDEPEILQVTVLKAAKNREEVDPSLIDKTLTGVVTKLSATKITIKTNKSRTYSFHITGDTVFNEKAADLEVGAKVRVRYDGYASDTPNAKGIKVTGAPDPDPTPVPVTKKTVSGTITEKAGNSLVIETTSGKTYSFLLGSVTITGYKDARVGDWADVTFYKDNHGIKVVTKIHYEQARVY